MAFTAYRYRIYPTSTQAVQLVQTFGCVRFVYNQCLNEEERLHAEGLPFAGKNAMNAWCNHDLKDRFLFLKDVDKFAITNAVWHLVDGYKRFFEGNGKHPRYKSRHRSRMSYTTNVTNRNIEVGDKYVKLPKLGKVRAVIHREIPDGMRIKSATVSMERDGTFYCSVLCEYEEAVYPVQMPEQNAVGLDYKSDGLYVSSDGDVCGSPKYYRRSGKRLAKLQRELSRKVGSRKGEKESANHRKQRRKVAKLLRHVANQRRDYIHKRSTEIANRYDLVAVEDLDMRTLSNKGFGNGKATLDNGYGMFLDLLEYKLRDRGKTLIRVDKWFPSSQLCSCCGHQNPSVKSLSVRKWTCPVCGTPHDRDINAAVDIRDEGIRQYLAG